MEEDETTQRITEIEVAKAICFISSVRASPLSKDFAPGLSLMTERFTIY